MNPENKDIKITLKDIKSFEYEKGGMKLSFSFDANNKQEISAFLDLLKKAIEDVSPFTIAA